MSLILPTLAHRSRDTILAPFRRGCPRAASDPATQLTLAPEGPFAPHGASPEAVRDDLPHLGPCRLRAEVGQNPGRSRLVPRIKLSAGFKIDHELERSRIVASVLRDLAGELGQCLWTR
jgi:hypothetical protein